MSWVLALVGFVALIILHELGHFAAAKAVGMRVERFSLFFPPLLVRKKIGETEYAIGAIPAGGYVKISGMSPAEQLPDEVRTRAYHAQPVWKRVVVILAGPLVNVVLALVLLTVFYGAIGVPALAVDTTSSGFPAHGQLRQGDRVVSVDGHRGNPDQLANVIAADRCPGTQTAGCGGARPLTVVVERQGRTLTFAMRPLYDAGKGVDRMRLGFSWGDTGPRQTQPALSSSLHEVSYVTGATVRIPGIIFNSRQRAQVHGIVGIAATTHQTILHDPANAVFLLGVISLALAIINLFPFLPLDGGHIFWALVELVRRRPVSYSVMERSGVVGFALVLMLFFVGLTNDINTLTGGGFSPVH